MVEVTIATTENQMDPHAVTACLPCERGRKSERENERGHVHHHRHRPHNRRHHLRTHPRPRPSLSPWRGAPSQRNYAKSPTRKIRDTTSRRVPTCCIVISGNLRVQPARVLGVTVRSRSRISKARRWFASLTRHRASYGKYAHRFARNQASICT